MSRPIAWMLAAGLAAAAPALAQTTSGQTGTQGTQGGVQTGKQAGQEKTLQLPKLSKGIKGSLSFMGSWGLDLDVFGELLLPAIGQQLTPDNFLIQYVLVDKAVPYPDVYVDPPQRYQGTIGFGIFEKDELIARFGRSRYPTAKPGSFAETNSANGKRRMTVTFGEYRDEVLEFGLRHYMRATGRSKAYANLIGGKRKVEAISASFIATGDDGNLGVIRLYDAAKLTTFGIEFGVTVERSIFGFYVESGVRIQKKLASTDADLNRLNFKSAESGTLPATDLALTNDTGSRIFIPVQFGLVIRLF